MKILIVDDVSFMLVSMRQLLERHGHKVVAVGDGEAALNALSKDFTIEVVITDLIMPEMSGLDLYRRAQLIQRFNDEGEIPSPPFLLLSAFEKTNPSPHWVAQFQEASNCFAGTLHKPIVEAELLALLNQLDYESTESGTNSKKLRSVLQQALEKLQSIRNRSELELIVDRLEREITEFRAATTEAVVSA